MWLQFIVLCAVNMIKKVLYNFNGSYIFITMFQKFEADSNNAEIP